MLASCNKHTLTDILSAAGTRHSVGADCQESRLLQTGSLQLSGEDVHGIVGVRAWSRVVGHRSVLLV